jgi:hypothetical protein
MSPETTPMQELKQKCLSILKQKTEIERLKRIKVTKIVFWNSFPHATDRIHVMDTPIPHNMLDNGDFTVAVQLFTYFPYFIEPNFRCHIRKSPPMPVTILSQMNPPHTPSPTVFKNHVNIIFPSMP